MNRRAFLTGCAGVALTGCRSKAVIEPAPPIRLYAAGRNPVAFLPVFAAHTAGLFAQAGVNVSFRDGGAEGDPAAALMAGQADVVAGLYEDVLRAAAAGNAFTAFALATRSPLLAIVASPAARVRNLEDLLKVRIALPEEQSPEHVFLNYNYFQEGGEPVDLKTVVVGYGSPLANALIKKTAGAAVADSLTLRYILQDIPDLEIVADTRTLAGVIATYGVSSYPGAVLFTTRRWLQSFPHAAQRLRAALVRAGHWIRTRPAEQAAEAIPEERRGADPAILAEAVHEAYPLFSQDGAIPADGAREALKAVELASEAVKKAHLDLKATYTSAFAPLAEPRP